MHSSSALKKEKTEAVLSLMALLTKMDRSDAKQTFVNLKENTKNYGNKV